MSSPWIQNIISGIIRKYLGGGSDDRYQYDWATGQYEDEYGNVVSWDEVNNNYVIPNAVTMTDDVAVVIVMTQCIASLQLQYSP